MGKGSKNKKVRKAGVSGNPAARARAGASMSARGITEDESLALALLMKEEDERTILRRFRALLQESINLSKPALLLYAIIAVQRNEHVTFDLLVMVEMAIRRTSSNANEYAAEFDEVYEKYRPPHSNLLRGSEIDAVLLDTFIAIVEDAKSEARIAALWKLAASHFKPENPAHARRLYDAFEHHEHADGGVIADVILTR